MCVYLNNYNNLKQNDYEETITFDCDDVAANGSVGRCCEIDGIYYNLISKGKVAEVTENPNKYSGSVIIPQSVNYKDVDYCVSSIGNNAFFVVIT